MGDLDKKLSDNLVHALVTTVEHINLRGFDRSDPVVNDLFIKAFEDAGWIKPSISVWTPGDRPEQTIEQNKISDRLFEGAVPFVNLITGQEWFNRFEKEMWFYMPMKFYCEHGNCDVLERSDILKMARRAAGIKE